jgi:hypothetical protein
MLLLPCIKSNQHQTSKRASDSSAFTFHSSVSHTPNVSVQCLALIFLFWRTWVRISVRRPAEVFMVCLHVFTFPVSLVQCIRYTNIPHAYPQVFFLDCKFMQRQKVSSAKGTMGEVVGPLYRHYRLGATKHLMIIGFGLNMSARQPCYLLHSLAEIRLNRFFIRVCEISICFYWR